MKTQLLLIMFVLSTLTVFSQAYTFSSTTGTYTDLVGSTLLNIITTWDDPTFTVPLGFNFQYFNSGLSQITIDGNWGLGADLTNNTSGIGELLIPYGVDLVGLGGNQGTSASNISYLLSGNTGSQILKIEWKNSGFYGDTSRPRIDYVNFQLWFYEGSNNLEIHFGPSSITQGFLGFNSQNGPHIGLFPQYDFVADSSIAVTAGFVLTGDPASPTMVGQDSVYSNYLNGVPPNGSIYKFTKSSTPTTITENENAISIYPNPIEDFVTISGINNSIYGISITNGNGQIVRQISKVSNSIDLSDLDAGFYFIQLTMSTGELITKKIIKK